MTTAAKTIQSSPLAPYMELMKSVDVNVMHAVVEYLNETIREIEEAKRLNKPLRCFKEVDV